MKVIKVKYASYDDIYGAKKYRLIPEPETFKPFLDDYVVVESSNHGIYVGLVEEILEINPENYKESSIDTNYHILCSIQNDAMRVYDKRRQAKIKLDYYTSELQNINAQINQDAKLSALAKINRLPEDLENQITNIVEEIDNIEVDMIEFNEVLYGGETNE